MIGVASTVASSIAPVQNGDNKHPRFKCSRFFPPCISCLATNLTKILVKIPAIKLPFQRSISTAKLFVDPKMINCTIPMPIPFTVAQKPDRSGLRGFIAKLKPKFTIGSSAPTRQA